MKERMREIDVLKGIGIILVVFGHVIPRGAAWNLIYGCHMPLFVFCSGLFTGRTLKWKRLAKITVAYILLAALSAGTYYCLFEGGNIYYIKQTVYNVLVGGFSPKHGIYPVEALWFLPCLMVITLLFYAVCFIPNPLIRHAAIICAVFAGMILTRYRDSLPMYYNVDISLLLLPFFYIAFHYGKCLRRKVIQTGEKPVITMLGIMMVYILCAMINGEINIFRGLYGRSLVLYYISGFLGIAWLWSVSAEVARYQGVIACILQKLGQHTLVIMGTHQLLLVILRQKCNIDNEHYLRLLSPFVIAATFAFSNMITCVRKIARRKKI